MPCPGAGANAESEPTTGNRFSNIPSGRNKRRRNSCARSCSSARPQRNVPKKPEPVNAPYTIRLTSLINTAWRACFIKRGLLLLTRCAVSRPICANSSLISRRSTQAFVRMRLRPFVFYALAVGPLPTGSSVSWPMGQSLRLRCAAILLTRRSPITTISAYLGLCRHFPPPFIVSRY